MIQRILPAVLISLLAAPGAQAGEVETLLAVQGKLDKQDQTLPNGEWTDIYTINLSAGDRVMIEMESKKVDTFIVLRGPDDTVYENNDDGSKKRSALDVFVETSGTWLVYATSKGAADKGKYSLSVKADRSGTGGGMASGSGDAGIGTITPGTPLSGTLLSLIHI